MSCPCASSASRRQSPSSRRHDPSSHRATRCCPRRRPAGCVEVDVSVITELHGAIKVSDLRGSSTYQILEPLEEVLAIVLPPKREVEEVPEEEAAEAEVTAEGPRPHRSARGRRIVRSQSQPERTFGRGGPSTAAAPLTSEMIRQAAAGVRCAPHWPAEWLPGRVHGRTRWTRVLGHFRGCSAAAGAGSGAATVIELPTPGRTCWSRPPRPDTSDMRTVGTGGGGGATGTVGRGASDRRDLRDVRVTQPAPRMMISATRRKKTSQAPNSPLPYLCPLSLGQSAEA